MKLFYFFMQSMSSQERIVFLDLQAIRSRSFILGGGVAGGGFTLLSRLGAFKSDDNSAAFFCHILIPF